MRDYNRAALYPYTKTLSSTEVLDYYRDPVKFYKVWVEPFVKGTPAPTLDSPAVHFGLAFAELYADRSFDYVTYCRQHKVSARLIQHMGYVIKMFPELPKGCAEYELLVEYRGWKIRITLDGFLMHNGIIIENKTGALAWTQEVADGYPQVTMQVWGYYHKYGEMPKKMMVNWVDTSTSFKKPVQTFITTRTLEQLQDFQALIIDPVIDNLEAKNFSTPFNTIEI